MSYNVLSYNVLSDFEIVSNCCLLKHIHLSDLCIVSFLVARISLLSTYFSVNFSLFRYFGKTISICPTIALLDGALSETIMEPIPWKITTSFKFQILSCRMVQYISWWGYFRNNNAINFTQTTNPPKWAQKGEQLQKEKANIRRYLGGKANIMRYFGKKQILGDIWGKRRY